MSNSTSSGADDYYTSTDDCTSVSALCPVEATIYGYYPNLGANAFFCAYFAIFTITNVALVFRFKAKLFGSLVALGCLSEMIGYIGRLIMHSNPWSNAGFETQICTLIFAPSFFAAGIYFLLKNMVRSIGPQYSILRASLYPWIFISCDIFSLVLQAVGGAVAASSNTSSGSDIGGHVMLAGIVFQVATFTFLYILTAAFIIKLRRGASSLTTDATAVLYSRDFKVFVSGVFVASLAIYVRCLYRIAELAGGWANDIMRNENEFIVLDGVMCGIAVLALTVVYPGIFFKPMSKTRKLEEKGSVSESEEPQV